eukprot:1191654-Prorocentrum_minimum.AAC.2
MGREARRGDRGSAGRTDFARYGDAGLDTGVKGSRWKGYRRSGCLTGTALMNSHGIYITHEANGRGVYVYRFNKDTLCTYRYSIL